MTNAALDETKREIKSANATRDIGILCFASACMILGAGQVTQWMSGSFTGSGFLWLAIVTALYVSAFVEIGFAGAIALLWIQHPLARSGVAILLQTLGWILFLIGVYDVLNDPPSEQQVLEATSVFLMSAMGGFVPIGLMIWLRRWRLCFGDRLVTARPIGILDLMTFITVVAAIFAFNRASGIFSSASGIEMPELLMFAGLYSLAGVVVTSSLLIAMRVILGPAEDRFNARTISGVILTFALTAGIWGFLISTEGAPSSQGSLTWQFIVLCLAMWGSAAFTSVAICLWLRRCGLRLNSSRIEAAQIALLPDS